MTSYRDRIESGDYFVSGTARFLEYEWSLFDDIEDMMRYDIANGYLDGIDSPIVDAPIDQLVASLTDEQKTMIIDHYYFPKGEDHVYTLADDIRTCYAVGMVELDGVSSAIGDYSPGEGVWWTLTFVNQVMWAEEIIGGALAGDRWDRDSLTIDLFKGSPTRMR